MSVCVAAEAFSRKDAGRDMCMSAICASRAKSSPLRGASKTTRNGLIPYPKYRSVSFFHQITDKLRDSNFILAVGGRRERTPVDAGLEDDHRVDARRVFGGTFPGPVEIEAMKSNRTCYGKTLRTRFQ